MLQVSEYTRETGRQADKQRCKWGDAVNEGRETERRGGGKKEEEEKTEVKQRSARGRPKERETGGWKVFM